MKTLRWLPLTYLAGQHGFMFFAPYLAVVLMAGYVLMLRQRAS